LRDIQDLGWLHVGDRYLEFLEKRRTNPGNETFQILISSPEVDIGKSRENSEVKWR
jgi:hypothetical protein